MKIPKVEMVACVFIASFAFIATEAAIGQCDSQEGFVIRDSHAAHPNTMRVKNKHDQEIRNVYPGIAATEKALRSGSPSELSKKISITAGSGLQKSFASALEKTRDTQRSHVLAGRASTKENFCISRELLKKVEAEYGKDAVERLIRWENLILQDNSKTDQEKLNKVNNFFNETVRFASDIEIYGVKDYWATPFEFLARCVGDCEDFAIAKFFTLKAMGIDEEKLNIAYVKALKYNMQHMVLTYYSHVGAEPLVLDNLVDSISLASRRPDLIPIFSFNGTGFRLSKP